MKSYDKITPQGTRDLLFSQCKSREQVQSTLAKLYEQRGFGRVRTPSIEFFDVFNSNARYFPQESMFKLMDNKGRLLVMRPDCTIPIARLVATRAQSLTLPLRLYYNQDVFRTGENRNGKSNEIRQLGVELIGSGSLKADVEMLELAYRSLNACGFGDFRIELCHIGFFKILIDSLPADEQTKETIRAYIEAKNYPALGDLLDRFEDCEAVNAIRKLPRLFGGIEVLDRALSLFSDARAKEVLDDLRRVYEMLNRLGLSDRVMLDLGLVNQADYYTGIVFRGYLHGAGEPVLSGGRYDKLIGDFGLDAPAIGFGVHVDLLARAIEEQNGVGEQESITLIYSDDDHLADALSYLDSLIEKGICAQMSVFDSLDETKAYANSLPVGEIHLVEDTIRILTDWEGKR